MSAWELVTNSAGVSTNTSGGPYFKCKACGATGAPYDGFCRKCGYLLSQDEMLKRADALIERDIQSRTPYPIKGLAYIRGIGRIDLEVGKKGSPPGYDYGSGLSKLLKKHREEIKNLALTLVLGKTAKGDEEDRLIRVHGDRFAAIGKRPFGGSVITHYKDAKKAASFESRPVNAGAVGRLSMPTLHPNLALADGIGVAASDGYYRIFPPWKSSGNNETKTTTERNEAMQSTNRIVQNALAAKAATPVVGNSEYSDRMESDVEDLRKILERETEKQKENAIHWIKARVERQANQALLSVNKALADKLTKDERQQILWVKRALEDIIRRSDTVCYKFSAINAI